MCILDDPDLLHLVLPHCADLDLGTINVQHPQPTRAIIRLLCHTARRQVDGLVTAYRDCRRSRDALLRVLPADIAASALEAMRRLGPLRQLQLEGLNDDALEAILCAAADPASGQRLESLSLQRGTFSGSCVYTCSSLMPAWEDAAAMLPRLTELELGGCGYLTDAGLEALTAAAPLLTRLRVTVNALLRRPRLTCPQLRHATLTICANLTDDAVDDLCAGAPLIEELSLWRCSSLRNLRVRGARLTSLNLCECTSMSDAALRPLASACPRLTTLLIAGCESLTSELDASALALGPFVSPAPAGAEAAQAPMAPTGHAGGSAPLPLLPGSPATPPAPLPSHAIGMLSVAAAAAPPPPPSTGTPDAASSCLSLTALDVSDVLSMNDVLLSAACAAAPNLKHLDFSRSGPAVIAPRVGGPCLQSLVGTRCEAIADDAVTAACQASPQLATLMLALCATLHTPRIHAQRLTDLNMSGCMQLQDAAVTHACCHCPSLSRISLSLCAQLVSPTVRGPLLRRIELSHCEHLSRPAIGGPSVEQLSLSGCLVLEDAPLEAACRDCPRLTKLSIDGCGHLVAAELQSPSLQTLSCQHVPAAIVASASDRKRLPSLLRIVAGETSGFEEVN